VTQFRTKIEKVEAMIRENVKMELQLLDKAMELQTFRDKLSLRYEKYARRISEMSAKSGEEGDQDEFVPAKLPPMMRSNYSAKDFFF